MSIAEAILDHYPDLNDAQKSIVAHTDGPLLVIAGPGSGKTYSIVLRALNLLLLGKASPRQIVLCTFTEKAAFEMRDRLSAAARQVCYKGDLYELRVLTIHGLSNQILTQHRHRTELGCRKTTSGIALAQSPHFISAGASGPDSSGTSACPSRRPD